MLITRPAGAKNKAERIVLVDGLRGIAAIGVVCVHAGGIFYAGSRSPGDLMDFASKWVYLGASGVDIFFVISGFVIAYSIGRQDVTSKYAAYFVMRRAVRLDPLYWFSIILALAVVFIRDRFGHNSVEVPSFAAIASHIFYLQRILGYEHIQAVYWTLCLEVQFYLVFIGILLGSKMLSAVVGCNASRVTPAIITVAFVVSLSWPSGWVLLGEHFHQGAWFFPQWHKFLGGALVAYCCTDQLSKRTTIGALTAWGAVLGLRGFGAYYRAEWSMTVGLWVALSTASLLFLTVYVPAVRQWFGSRLFQYAGRISYSLYLVHLPVIAVTMGVQTRTVKGSPTLAALMFIVNFAAAVFVAAVAYQLVERPSLLLASRLKPSNADAPDRLAGGIEGPAILPSDYEGDGSGIPLSSVGVR